MKLITLMLLIFAGPLAAEAKVSQTERSVASQTATSSVKDVVKKIREDDNGVVVLLAKVKGSFYLRRDVANFDKYRGVLEMSLKKKSPIQVTFDSSELNILEVK